jgi:hypothetical protein
MKQIAFEHRILYVTNPFSRERVSDGRGSPGEMGSNPETQQHEIDVTESKYEFSFVAL